jgi:hypothetical protein
MMRTLLIQSLIIIFTIGYVNAQEDKFTYDFNGQLITWTNFNYRDVLVNQTGLRYIPELSAAYKLKDSWKVDTRLSFNSYGLATLADGELDPDAHIQPYRLWLRLSSERIFIRAGLQKINFGSANILRPLMWFDQLDPRDPLQLTEGVYGLLTRYYFLNNANLWVWVLYGNEGRRGWDLLGSDPEKAEYGGRFQFPVGPGELAISYHQRALNLDSLNLPAIYYPPFRQDRLGIDGKWDVGVGLWFENSLKRNREEFNFLHRWTNKLTLGADYTFGLGNGLNLTFEQLIWSASNDFLQNSENIHFSALSANYPIGFMDRISAIVYFNWNTGDFYRILTWNRDYNRFSLYFLAYWNPESYDLYQSGEVSNLFAGKGIQIMLNFSH